MFRIFKLGLNPPCNNWLSDNDRLDEIFGPMPELPPPFIRIWTIQRKATIIEAVHGGWVPIEEVCRLYMISVDEFLSWERDVFCTHRLRTTPTRHAGTEKISSDSVAFADPQVQ
jgi:hypothetical protein